MAVVTRCIDFNRGSDSNDGTTKNQAWKNLSKLSNLNVSGGSQILLANDSVWEINPSLTASNRVVLDAMQGGEGSPIYVGGYDFAGVTGTKPTIKYRMFPAAGDWTWDAVLSAWYVQFTPAYLDADSLVKIGSVWVPSSNQGGGGINSTLNGVTANSLRSYADTAAKRLYLAYEGDSSGVDPTTFWGAGQIMFGLNSAFTTFYFCPYTEFDGLKVQDGGRLLNLSMGDLGRVALGFKMHNCESDNTTGLIAISTDGIGASGHGNVDIYDNVCTNIGAPAIKTYGDSLSGYIRNNTLTHANMNQCWGGAIYTQASVATGQAFEVSGNVVDDAKNGVGTCTFDGCGIYADLGDDGTVFKNNIVKNSFKAFQLNSGRAATLHANIAYNCCKFGSFTDADTVGTSDYTLTHNLFVATPTPEYYAFGTQENGGSPIAMWCNNIISGGRVENNLIVVNSAYSGIVAMSLYQSDIWTASGITGMDSVRNNVCIGFDTHLIDTAPNTTDKSAVYPQVSGTVSGIMNISGIPAKLSADSHAAGEGVDQAARVLDYNGTEYFSPPSCGPFEVQRIGNFFTPVWMQP